MYIYRFAIHIPFNRIWKLDATPVSDAFENFYILCSVT
jgi:hypothetical protein